LNRREFIKLSAGATLSAGIDKCIGIAWSPAALLALSGASSVTVDAQDARVSAGSSPLTQKGNFAAEMVDCIHRFLLAETDRRPRTGKSTGIAITALSRISSNPSSQNDSNSAKSSAQSMSVFLHRSRSYSLLSLLARKLLKAPATRGTPFIGASLLPKPPIPVRCMPKACRFSPMHILSRAWSPFPMRTGLRKC
jgi:hypothetical protein